jgi:hypothetical protein
MNLGLKQVSRAIAILEQPSSPLYEDVLAARLSLPSAVALVANGEVGNIERKFKNAVADEVTACLAGDGPRSPNGSLFKRQEREFFVIRSSLDLLSEKFDFFCDRFRRSITNGRRSQGYRDLRDAFFEMSDNVVSHAGVDSAGSHFGIAAYEATASGGCFTVCDTGCGFVQSLARNEKWRTITTHSAAISAVVLQQATSRPGETSGGGFKGLFAALAELNSVTLLRSGDCLASISTTGSGPELTFSPSGTMIGSQVTVLFSTSGPPAENFH